LTAEAFFPFPSFPAMNVYAIPKYSTMHCHPKESPNNLIKEATRKIRLYSQLYINFHWNPERSS